MKHYTIKRPLRIIRAQLRHGRQAIEVVPEGKPPAFEDEKSFAILFGPFFRKYELFMKDKKWKDEENKDEFIELKCSMLVLLRLYHVWLIKDPAGPKPWVSHKDEYNRLKES